VCARGPMGETVRHGEGFTARSTSRPPRKGRAREPTRRGPPSQNRGGRHWMLVCVSIRVGRGTRPQRYGPHAHGRRAGKFPRGPTRVPVGAPPHRCRQTAAAAPLHPPTVVVWRRFPQTTGRRPCAARCVARAHPPPPPPPHPTGCRLGACPSPTRVRPTDRRQGVWAPKGLSPLDGPGHRRRRAAVQRGEKARPPTESPLAVRVHDASVPHERRGSKERPPDDRAPPSTHRPSSGEFATRREAARALPVLSLACVQRRHPRSRSGAPETGTTGMGRGGKCHAPRPTAGAGRPVTPESGIHGLADGCAKDPRVGRVGWHLRPTASTPPSKKNSESVTGALERPSTEEHGGWGVRL